MPDLKPLTEDEMREQLEQAFLQNREDRLPSQFLELLKDPACPPDKGYRQYLRPVVAIAILLALIVMATFIYFSTTT